MAPVVDLLDHPYVTCQRDTLPGRRGHHDGAELLGLAAYGVLLVFLEHRIELERVREALAGQPHDKAAALGSLDVVGLDEVAQQRAKIVERDAPERAEGEHAFGQARRRQLAAARQRRHRLMVEQAVGQPVGVRRLNPAFLEVKLDEGDTLEKLPRDALRQHRAGFGFVLAHDEPHLGRQAATPGAAHTLQKRRHREGGVYLKRTLEPPDVDAELERGGGDGREEARVVLHRLLGRLAIRRRQVAVVDEEPVGLVHGFAVLAQRRGDRFALLPRVDEDQAFLVARVLKDISDAGVGRLGGRVARSRKRHVRGGQLDGKPRRPSGWEGVGRDDVGKGTGRRRRPGWLVYAEHAASHDLCLHLARNDRKPGTFDAHRRRHPFGLAAQARLVERRLGGLPTGGARGVAALLPGALACLRPAYVEVLHREPPGLAFVLHLRDHRTPTRPGGKEPAGELGVADGRRKPDAPGVDAGKPPQALDEAQRLPAAVAPQQRVHLVDDDEPKVAEEPADRGVLVEQQRLERLGRDLQDARRMLEQARLVRLRHIPVPVPHGDAGLGAQVVEARKLVVDERLERADVESAHRGGRVLGKQREYGEEHRLGLPRRRGGAQQHVFVGVEDGVARRHLRGAQRFPFVPVDEVLHERGIAVEDAHRRRTRYSSNSANRRTPTGRSAGVRSVAGASAGPTRTATGSSSGA